MGQEEKGREDRFIPIQVRFVPKDVWLRMHIDSRSTIGSVKDAVLDRLKMPAFDPTVLANFYDEAGSAMAKPALFPSEAKAFPKAFLARVPKRNVGEVIDSDLKKSQQKTTDFVKSSPSKLNPRSKGKDSFAAARDILGGEPGDGGMGTLSFVGRKLTSDNQQRTQDSMTGEGARKGESLKLLSSPSSSSSPSMKLMSVRGSRALKARASMASLSAAARGSQSSASAHGGERVRTPPSVSSAYAGAANQSSNLLYDPTVAAGLDAYVDVIEISGNTEAKRKEEEAMAFMNRTESTSSFSFGPQRVPGRGSQGRPTTTSNRSPSLSYSIQKQRPATANEDAVNLDIDYSTTDDESQRSPRRGTSSKSPRSSESDSSIISQLQKQYTSSDWSQPALLAGQGRSGGELLSSGLDTPSDGASIALSNATTERGRSGTIIAGSDASKTRPAAVLNLSARSSDRPSSSSSSGAQLRNRASRAKETRESQAASDAPLAVSSPRLANRIAGIHLDEISSWKDAQHAMSQFYSVHSYSNGILLEDWRTVAAFRLRPFELLEVQHANPQEKYHLPRAPDRVDLNGLRRSSSTTLLEVDSNPTSNDQYIEPFSEGWCYIFKRNGGTAKAQRAGLGVWKLRFIMVRGAKLAIYRKKPTRASINEAQHAKTWDLNQIECVFSERADGITRPALMPIDGLCREILSLSFKSAAAPASLVNSESSSGWALASTISLSMRFISHSDHCAFFNTFARAQQRTVNKGQVDFTTAWRKKVVARATIAGRGGTVVPGRAGRRAGRNALARSRLRPTGVSRDFDDADRWSSQSESEEFGKPLRMDAFSYADLHASIPSTGVTCDPSYEARSSSHHASASTSHPLSHLEHSPSQQGQERERDHLYSQLWGPTTTTSEMASIASTVSATGGTNSSKLGRSRGFSLARSARKVISPTESSFSASQRALAAPSHLPPTTPTKSTFSTSDGHFSDPRRQSQRETVSTSDSPTGRHFRNSIEGAMTKSKRSNVQTAGNGGSSARLSQQSPIQTSPGSGRHRSHTVDSPTSSPATKRSSTINSKQPPQPSSSKAAVSGFQWPFRATYSRASPSTGNGGGGNGM